MLLLLGKLFLCLNFFSKSSCQFVDAKYCIKSNFQLCFIHCLFVWFRHFQRRICKRPEVCSVMPFAFYLVVSGPGVVRPRGGVSKNWLSSFAKIAPKLKPDVTFIDLMILIIFRIIHLNLCSTKVFLELNDMI